MAIPSGWPIEVGEAIILNISIKVGGGAVIIQGRRLIQGQLLFKEIRYSQ